MTLFDDAPAPLAVAPDQAGARLDLDRLVTSRLLVQANSGGGKSRALRYLLEGTHGRVQQVVLDYEGEFKSLRERFDYLLVGPDGDVPADVRTAAQLARRVMELGVSTIVDLSELPLLDQRDLAKQPDAQDRRRYVARFLTALMGLPRRLWRPLLVVIDEAHVFAPERGSGESEARNAVVALATAGRKRGYALVAATQRIAKLSNDAAADLLNVLVGRTSFDVDLKRAGDALGMDKAGREALKYLQPGEFFAHGPAINPTIVKVRTGDVLTSHPEPGRAAPPPPPTPEAIRALLDQLGDLPAEAADDAQDLDAARRRIADLERQIAARPRSAPERVVERVEVEVPMLDEAAIEQIRGLSAQIGAVVENLDVLRDLRQRIGDLTDRFLTAQSDPAGRRRQGPAQPLRVPTPLRAVDPGPPAPKVPQAAPTPPAGTLGSAERKVLTVLAQHPSGRTPVQVALMTEYTASGGRFRNVLGGLRSAGLIEGRDQIVITDAGRAALGDWQPLPAGRALLEVWLQRLTKSEGLLLQAAYDATPPGLSPEELAARTGYEPTGGRFRNLVGRLRTLELIEGREMLRTNPTFHEGG